MIYVCLKRVNYTTSNITTKLSVQENNIKVY